MDNLLNDMACKIRPVPDLDKKRDCSIFALVPKPELYRTKSGEFTLYLPDMDETYHSRDGAISESQHVFIEHGLNAMEDSRIRVLEVGFGTGLNALLSLKQAESKNLQLDYHTLEPFPLDEEIWSALDYGDKERFEILHQLPWEQKQQIDSHFQLTKYLRKLELFETSLIFDLVYFDAFAPQKQAELWHIEVLTKLFDCLRPGGRLTTYSAAGQFKRNLKAIGFKLIHPSGANGKREMTVAIRP